MRTPQALSMPALQREAAWAEERLLGDLRQSVPQNGRVHLHIIDVLLLSGENPCAYNSSFRGDLGFFVEGGGSANFNFMGAGIFSKKGWFQKGWLWWMFTKHQNEVTCGCSSVPKNRDEIRMFPCTKNWNKAFTKLPFCFLICWKNETVGLHSHSCTRMSQQISRA